MSNPKDFAGTLDHVIFEFRDAISRVSFATSLAVADFKRSHKALLENQANSIPHGMSIKLHLRDWYSLQKPSTFDFSMTEQLNAEYTRTCVENLNDQLKWQLATIFELQETFVKDLYAGIGFLDNGAWTGNDYGKNLTSEIEEKDTEWFKFQVRNAHKGNCNEIYKQFKKLFPEYATQPVELTFTRIVFEKLRHLIVHQQGKTTNEKFWSAIKKGHGVSLEGDGETAINARQAVERVVPMHKGIRTVWLINNDSLKIQEVNKLSMPGEAPKIRMPSYHGIDRPLNKLRDFMIDYTCMLYAMVIRRFGEKPFWMRN